MNARLFVAVLAAFAVGCGSRAESPGTAPGATLSTASTTSRSPAATASPTPRPNPTSGPGTYTSVALAYRVELPDGWRRAACGSGVELTHLPAVEAFTSASADDEVFSDIGPGNPGISVFVDDNVAKLTALQWLESGKLGHSVQTRFEKASFDDKADAARIVTVDGSLVIAVVVGARGHIHAIQRVGPPPGGGGPPLGGGTVSSQTNLLNSLHVLSDVELSDAKATLASPAPAAARTVEEVADALAQGFSHKDTAALATVAGSCLQQGAEQAGASSRPGARLLSDLKNSFANGLVVTPQARPIEDQSTPNSPNYSTIRATWTEAGKAARNVKLMMQKVGNTWYWFGVLYLQG